MKKKTTIKNTENLLIKVYVYLLQVLLTNGYYKLPQKHLLLWSKVDKLDLPQAVTFIWPVAWPPIDPASWPSLCPRLTQALDSSERALVMALAFICGRGCQIEKSCTHTLCSVILPHGIFFFVPFTPANYFAQS